MWNNSAQLDKYLYARTNALKIKFIGILGILTTLLMAYGMWHYLQLHVLYILFFGPIVFIFIGNKLMRYIMQLFYQQFHIKKHEQFIQTFWSTHKEPPVDIFLPWAGEELHIHEEVIKAVSQLQYTNYKVYMLDDVGKIEHQKLAEQYGFNYLSRPNKGVYKKSGNLEYGYNHSNGQFVLILDADFIPANDVLRDLIPYIATDEKIGILQTPQFFEQTKDIHKKSKIEFGGGNIVEDFYRIIMPCRDEFKAAMCVGTSAIYRRAAIEKLQGTPKVHASEDLATGLLITQHGYYVKYLPLIVSIGKSPETFQAYFKQHMRWCSGNLVFAKYWPTARLSTMARIIYLVNPMYYFSEALNVIFSFQFLTLLYFHADSLSLHHSLYFLPYVIVSRIIVPLNKANKNKLGTRLAALNNSYTYFYTYIRMLTKGIPAWQPTGVKSAGLHKDFVNAFNIGFMISTIYILCFLGILLTKPLLFRNYNTYIILGWSFYSVFWHALYISFVSDYMHPIKLANAKTFIEKSYIYTKTHLTYVLFFILVGVCTFNGSVTILEPPAPETVAMLTPLAHISPTSPIKSAVLGAQIETNVTSKYLFTVSKGDSLIKLAEQAIDKFSEDNNLTLTQSQIRYAATTLLDQNEYTALIKPGQQISFELSTIIGAVEKAINRLNH